MSTQNRGVSMRFRTLTLLSVSLALALPISGCGLASLFGTPSPTSSPTTTP